MARARSQEHGPAVVDRIARTYDEVDVMLKLGKQVFGRKGSPMFPLDMLANAAIKRNIATAEAAAVVI